MSVTFHSPPGGRKVVCSTFLMARIVQKYGGTSVGDVERIKKVAERIKAFRDEGNELVVVVSARAGVTNELLARAMSSLVTPARADTTTTSSLPSSRNALMRFATFLMRSTSPTDVPPYFWTMRAIGAFQAVES